MSDVALRTRSRESSLSDAGSAESVVERSPRGSRFFRFNRQLFGDHSRPKRVYLAFDSETGREVAWSVIPLLDQCQEDVDKALQVAKALDHPRIVKILNAWINFQDEEIVYISERVAGCSLRQYIGRLSGNLKLKIIQTWTKQILEALDYLHSKDVVHNKISCASIYVNAGDGSVLLGDIEASAGSADKSSDLRALADCVLEMATRKPGTSDVDVLKNDDLKNFIVALRNECICCKEALHSGFILDTSDSIDLAQLSPKDFSPSRRSSLESVPETAGAHSLAQKLRQDDQLLAAKNKLATEIARTLNSPVSAVKQFIL